MLFMLLLLFISGIVRYVFNLSGGDSAISRPTQTMLENLKAYVRTSSATGVQALK